MLNHCRRSFFLVAILAGVCGGLSATPVSSLMCANPGSTTASSNAANIFANSCTDFSYAFPSTQPATGLNNWQYGYYSGASSTTPAFDPAMFTFLSPTPAVDSTGVPTGGNAGWWSQNFSLYWTSLDAFGGHSNAGYTDLHPSPYCNQSLYANCGIGYDPRSPNSPGSGDYWATRRYVVPGGYSGFVSVSLSSEKDPRTSLPGSMGNVEYIVEVHNGVATTLACLNVPVGGALNPVVAYPSCGAATTTVDPYSSGAIYSTSVQAAVQGGDYIDVILVPNYDTAVKTASGSSSGLADFSSGVFQLETLFGTGPQATIPEAGTCLLLASGLLGIAVRRRFTKRA